MQTAQPSTETSPSTVREATSQKYLMARRGSLGVFAAAGVGAGAGREIGEGVDGRSGIGADPTSPVAAASTSGDRLNPAVRLYIGACDCGIAPDATPGKAGDDGTGVPGGTAMRPTSSSGTTTW